VISIFLPIFKKTGDWKNFTILNEKAIGNKPISTNWTSNRIIGEFLIENDYRNKINSPNKILSKIPFVKSIYNVSKDVAGAFVSHGEKKAFKKSVVTIFPSKKSFCVGFETGEIPPICQKHIKEPLVPVFVPTAPHPISGYLLMVKKKHVKDVNMTNEETVKFTVSCGIITPDNNESQNIKDIKEKDD